MLISGALWKIKLQYMSWKLRTFREKNMKKESRWCIANHLAIHDSQIKNKKIKKKIQAVRVDGKPA